MTVINGGNPLAEKKSGKQVMPLFRLERYFYTRTFCVASPGYKKGEKQEGKIEVRANLMNHQEDPSRWKVSLVIGLSDKIDRSKISYDFSLSLEGFFVCPGMKEASDENRKKFAPLIYVQGSSLLYCMATEYLRNITAAGPYGPYLLPSYSFVPTDLKADLKKTKGIYVKRTPGDKGMVN